MEKVMLSFDKVSAHYGKIQALHEVSLQINQGEIVTLIGANGAGKTTLLGTLCGDPRAVSAHYGKIQALHEVSLQINQGEIVTLIGANGAGKTTLLGTLCGDPRATRGRIVFDDTDITDWQTAKIMREAVAIVPEGRRVFSRMTVEENLAMGGFAKIMREAVAIVPEGRRVFSRMTVEENLAMGGFFAERDQFQERIKWVYELFPRLHERRVQRAGTMSGGEQQMLAIGRALMSNPRLLLLDEPSLGLAPIIIQQIFDTIEQLREQGMTIFLVEQNANQALKLADRASKFSTPSNNCASRG